MKKTITQIIDEYETADQTPEEAELRINRAVGISFSGHTIYFAEAEIMQGQYRVLNYGSLATNMKFGTGIEGMEKNIRDVFSFINGMVDSYNITARYLNLSLNTHLVSILPVKIQGSMTNNEIETYITWEFSQHILDSISQYNVNTIQLEETPSKGDQWIMIAGVRKKIADNFQSVLEKSKLKLQNLDIDILCSHATYTLNYPDDPSGLTVIADLKPGVAGLLLCEGHAVKGFYQYVFSSKASPEQAADVLIHHLDNALYLFNRERNRSLEYRRVLLCNALAEEIKPLVEEKFYPECIQPFRTLVKPELFVETRKTTEENNDEPKEAPPEESLVMYAEPIGAAIKLLSV